MGNVFVFLKVTEQLDKLIELAIFEFKVVYECETIAYFAEHIITGLELGIWKRSRN